MRGLRAAWPVRPDTHSLDTGQQGEADTAHTLQHTLQPLQPRHPLPGLRLVCCTAAVMPASLYQSNFNLERISATEMDHRDSAVKLAMELANLCSFSNMSELEAGQGGQSCLSDHFSLGSGQTLAQISEELKAKKSQNMTECVPVPSSEHVAEIVGRQGE